MKSGDVVTIYEKPITKEQPEGEAVLIKKLSEHRGKEYWEIKFLLDDFICNRFICK